MENVLKIKSLNKAQEKIPDSGKDFENLFRSHYSDLVKLALIYLKDMDAAEDIVQELFIKIWQNRKKIIINTSVKNYLFTSVRNSVFNQLRDSKKIFVESEFAENLSTDNFNRLEYLELKKIINNEIEKLPDRCREVYLLSRNKKMTNKKIAEHLNISVKTVENQMTKALKRIFEKVSSFISVLIIFLIKIFE